MAPTTLSLFDHTMNIPTTNALMALLRDASAPKKYSATVFKVIHIGPNKLHMSILETPPFTGHVWEKIVSFDSLANDMRRQIWSHTITKLTSVISNDLPVDTTTAFMEASEVKENIIKNVLNINNLVGISFL